MSTILRTVGLIASVLLLSNPVFAQSVEYFPPANGSWAHRSPTDFGIDTVKINEAVAFAEANEYSGARDLRQAILKGFESEPFHKILGPTKKRGGPAGMILHKGYCIAEWGAVERVDMTFSVTKSYLSTLAGLALEDGLIRSVEDPVGQYVWSGEFDGAHNSTINWEHLLTQTSDWTGTLWGTPDWGDRPPRRGNMDDWKFRELSEPGARFEYNDVRVNLLAYSLLQVLRKPLPQVLKERIMDPIGASTTWRWYGYENSWVTVDGQWMQSVSGGGHSGGGVFISAEDHARFGLLFLNQGNWNGQQLFDPNWISAITTPATANSNYGYMWWLNREGRRYMEGVGSDVYYAAGFGGNFIVIDPTHDLVIVTRWLEPSKLADFLPIILDAFPQEGTTIGGK